MTQRGRHNVHLTLAINDSDQVRDLVTGQVPVAGIDLTCLLLEVEEIFFRFTRHREWDISELSLAKYCSLRAQGDESLIAIPVFPSRSFRHSAIYVRPDGPVDEPGALRGGRIGVPEWVVTATVYARALLEHEYGVGLREVEWVQGGTNEPGRVETLPIIFQDGISIRPERDRSLNDLLIADEIDAIIAPHPPAGFADGSGQIVRLFSDVRTVEEDYYRRTGIFPIMHTIVLRSEVHERYPWAALNLYTAFEAAKNRSLVRMLDTNAPRTPVPWAAAHASRIQAEFGSSLWPYGVAPNLTTINAFLEYAAEQGICECTPSAEDLFAPQVREFFRV